MGGPFNYHVILIPATGTQTKDKSTIISSNPIVPVSCHGS